MHIARVERTKTVILSDNSRPAISGADQGTDVDPDAGKTRRTNTEGSRAEATTSSLPRTPPHPIVTIHGNELTE